MPVDPNRDEAALKASKSPAQSTGGNLGKKHKKLIIFLILLILIVGPLVGILFTLLYW